MREPVIGDVVPLALHSTASPGPAGQPRGLSRPPVSAPGRRVGRSGLFPAF